MFGLVKIAVVSALLAAGVVTALESGSGLKPAEPAKPAESVAAKRVPAVSTNPCREAGWPYAAPACGSERARAVRSIAITVAEGAA